MQLILVLIAMYHAIFASGQNVSKKSELCIPKRIPHTNADYRTPTFFFFAEKLPFEIIFWGEVEIIFLGEVEIISVGEVEIIFWG